MRSLIITGEISKRQKYVENYIKDEQIPEYSIRYFDEEIKVENAKDIRQILSKRYSQKYLIVISAPLNQIAQNALLKSIEELSENVSVLISLNNLSNVLDTIKSRFFLVALSGKRDEAELDSFVLPNNTKEALLLVDNFIAKNSDLSYEEQIDKFIRIYRKELFSKYLTLEREILKVKIVTFKKILNVSNLIKTNNVNLKFALENALI